MMTRVEHIKPIVKLNLNAYILANGPRKIKGGGEDQKARQPDERNKEVIFEKFCIIH